MSPRYSPVSTSLSLGLFTLQTTHDSYMVSGLPDSGPCACIPRERLPTEQPPGSVCVCICIWSTCVFFSDLVEEHSDPRTSLCSLGNKHVRELPRCPRDLDAKRTPWNREEYGKSWQVMSSDCLLVTFGT